MPTITTFLMFEGNAGPAIEFYTALFPDSSVHSMTRWGDGGPGTPGSVQLAVFSIAGQRVMCIDSFVKHTFSFTPSTSMYVACDTATEVDTLFSKLSDGGQVLMPLDSYPFNARYAWVNDRFGVSWQLALSAQ
ncbi:MAG TPA: VOC family protein [Casimicrobiaceae bacterium]|jgi:predicted 3-demethylubiquinone-9 3-methyltransferase (glyoxalase superfamily)